eukprot:1616784-Rhodomonas_salina.1
MISSPGDPFSSSWGHVLCPSAAAASTSASVVHASSSSASIERFGKHAAQIASKLPATVCTLCSGMCSRCPWRTSSAVWATRHAALAANPMPNSRLPAISHCSTLLPMDSKSRAPRRCWCPSAHT